MTRSDYTFVLEIVPTAPLTHGQGSEGNTQILMTRQVVIEVDGKWQRLEIPAVSGAAFKATLREAAVEDQFERIGVQEGAVSKDALRLLLKGGKNDSGGQTVPLAEARKLRDLFPALSVFGSMDAGLPLPGRIQVSDVMPWCEETVNAGLAPREIRPVHVDIEGEANECPAIATLFDGQQPIPLYLTRTEVTNYRHDMQSSPLLRMLEGPVQQAIEDRGAVVKAKRIAGEKPRATERRDANESMPHSAQAIAPGTPLFAVIRLRGATDVEVGCLLQALARWMQTGAHLGGGATKGHGACSVKIIAPLRHRRSGLGAADSTAIELPGVGTPGAMVNGYAAHVADRADAAKAFLSVATR